jgi:allophanate hydrolase
VSPLQPGPGSATALLAVCGAHLSGQPLNPFLLTLGAQFVAPDQTAPFYRMVALPRLHPAPGPSPQAGIPPRPGLIRLAAGGESIEVELYRMPIDTLGALLVTVAPPLAIGTLTLLNGEQVLGFVCEGYAESTSPDITRFGSWRGYVAQQEAAHPS